MEEHNNIIWFDELPTEIHVRISSWLNDEDKHLARLDLMCKLFTKIYHVSWKGIKQNACRYCGIWPPVGCKIRPPDRIREGIVMCIRCYKLRRCKICHYYTDCSISFGLSGEVIDTDNIFTHLASKHSDYWKNLFTKSE